MITRNHIVKGMRLPPGLYLEGARIRFITSVYKNGLVGTREDEPEAGPVTKVHIIDLLDAINLRVKDEPRVRFEEMKAWVEERRTGALDRMRRNHADFLQRIERNGYHDAISMRGDDLIQVEAEVAAWERVGKTLAKEAAAADVIAELQGDLAEWKDRLLFESRYYNDAYRARLDDWRQQAQIQVIRYVERRLGGLTDNVWAAWAERIATTGATA